MRNAQAPDIIPMFHPVFGHRSQHHYGGKILNLSDKTSRLSRTIVQAIIGAITAGLLVAAWNSYTSGHAIDPTLALVVGTLLTSITASVQLEYEDKSGKKLLAPTDVSE